jgi:puromycin-sensitive aminopeptidase
MTTKATTTTATEAAAYRLPKEVVPRRYDLTLTPDIGNARFEGEETVTIEVREPVRTITINAAELEIQSAELAQDGGRKIAATVALQEETQRAVLSLPQEIAAGTWTLRLRFTGVLNDKLRGFYRSTYRNESGQERALATTQFESTDARRAFPCWDEPALKAVFATTLVIDKGLTAISNASIKSEVADAATGKRTVIFNDTILLSTYLVAFFVGDFEGTPEIYVDGTPLRVWAPPGKEHLTRFALETGRHAVSFFNRYYGINYPGDKLDLLAIPDFAAGAMENLGASTFRETLLLLDEETSTHAELERVAEVEAHEIAHMWFGDLVTMQWWNGLWLKEAFATFMAALCADDYKPDWDTWTGFGLSRAGALLVDGLNSTRPIEFTVVKPEDAQAMYDVLTYEKGASVLRMLEQYLGGEVFRRGLHQYLTKHSYANAETSDLWDALEASSGQPVRKVADSWIFQPGYPLVSADYRDGHLVLSQERFLYRRQGVSSDQLWQVPVAIRFEGAGGPQTHGVLMSEGALRLPMSDDFRSLTVNAGGNGVFRVRYSPELLAKLTTDVQITLSPIERFNLVNDTWAAVQAGYTPLTDYLQLTDLFRHEPDVNVWSIILGSFSAFRRILDTEALPAFQQFVRQRLETVHQRLGWEPKAGESPLARQLRGQVLGALGTLGNEASIVIRARDHYARYKEDPASVDADVIAACVSVIATAGNQADYDEFWQQFKTARTPQEERRFLYSLAAFRDRTLLEDALSHGLDGEVRTQDAPFLVAMVFFNPEGGRLAWQFTRDHWDEMRQKYPDNTMIRIADGVTALNTPELADEAEAFFKEHPIPGAGKRLDQILERQRINVDFRSREAKNAAAFLTR